MALLVDRRWPENYDDPKHGVRFEIAFKWGNGGDMVPRGVVVLTEIEGEIFVADMLSGPWETFEEAVDAGKEAADKFVERYWVD